MLSLLEGRVAAKLPEPNFDVDRLLSFDAMRAHDMDAMRASLMQSLDPHFRDRVQPGDFILGGRNFGYGHPHGPPMALMREAGIAAVIASSFAPLYLEGETAAGFPQFACPTILDIAEVGDALRIDCLTWTVQNLDRGVEGRIEPLSAWARELIDAGGLFALLQR